MYIIIITWITREYQIKEADLEKIGADIRVETVNDRRRLDRYLRETRIPERFSTCRPNFFLLHYNPGELLTNPFSPSSYLQFVVEGELLLYDMPDEETTIMLQTTYNDVSMLGEMELLDARFTPFFVEAKTDVYTVAIYLAQYQQELLNDAKFLRYLCTSLASKLNGAVMASVHTPLRQRVLYYLRYTEDGGSITNISHTAKVLNVSSRHLIRVLKELCGEGLLEHSRKGVYRVLKAP